MSDAGRDGSGPGAGSDVEPGAVPDARPGAVPGAVPGAAPATEPDAVPEPGQQRVVVQRGLYYEELEPGVRYLHRPGRTLTEADNVLFSALTMNPQALHLDAAWSATQPFGDRLFNSMMTLAVLVGASVGHLTQGTLVANLGFTELAFPHPLFHGDTLYAETEEVAKLLSASRPGQAVVTFLHTGRNQDDVVVATATRNVLMWCRDRP